jgi:hypothetical protein
VGRDLSTVHNVTNVVNNVLVPTRASEATRYLIGRGVDPYRAFTDRPGEPWDLTIRGTEHISDLRLKLLAAPHLDHPTLITVRGTLFPCALLSSGWWERHGTARHVRPTWRDHLQEWLFNGFDLWAPSWDFTWDRDPTGNPNRPFCIAQLGGGDEADSIPVVIPREKARKLQERLRDGWGGVEATVTGLLGHREQFCTPYHELELFGGLLDFCLWLNQDDTRHRISILAEETGIYSGYLWKCVAPLSLLENNRDLHLNQAYFLWEHTNFAKQEAVAYNLDSLAHKEEYLRARHGDLVLIQKSSPLVPGNPEWSHEEIYDLLSGKAGPDI